ncbi:MAG: hypothetical protein U0469_00115 [Candidatus Paceibacterota bacterium]
MIIITAIIPYLIYGAVGGNIVGFWTKRKNSHFGKIFLLELLVDLLLIKIT